MGFWRVISKKIFDYYYGVCWCFCFVVFFLSDLLLRRGLQGAYEGLVIGYFD